MHVICSETEGKKKGKQQYKGAYLDGTDTNAIEMAFPADIYFLLLLDSTLEILSVFSARWDSWSMTRDYHLHAVNGTLARLAKSWKVVNFVKFSLYAYLGSMYVYVQQKLDTDSAEVFC